MKYYCVCWFLHINTGNQDRTLHSLPVGRFCFRIPGGTRSLFVLGDVQTCPTANPSSYSICAGRLIPQEESGRGKRRTTHLHLVPRVNNEWIYISSPYTPAFMVCKDKILHLSFRDKRHEVPQVRSLKFTICTSLSIYISQLPQSIIRRYVRYMF